MNGQPGLAEIRAVLAGRVPHELPVGACREAAVLLPLLQVDGHWQILLTRRTHMVEQHKGEISFPGGRRDDDDPDLMYTALREADEEVGIPPEEVKILGRLDDIYTITNFRVRPFVGCIPHPFAPVVSVSEIDEILVLPIAAFLEPDCFAETMICRAGSPYSIYFFRVNGCTVWGATGKILKQFLEVCFGFTPSGRPGSEVLSAMAEQMRQLPRRP